MKIALAGFRIESCTFSPLVFGAEDFRVWRGQALIDFYPVLSAYPDIEFVPIASARSIPGGRVDAGFYADLKTEICDGLQAAEVDGVFLHMHGAAYVDGMDDAEGDFLSAIRETVGPDCLLSASYDLHGNVSRRVVDALDLLTAYRTAPHIDVEETLERTLSLLVRCLREGIRPAKKMMEVPMLLPGEQTSTEWDPGKTLYEAIPAVIDGEAVMDASILVGYLWADEPRAGASVLCYGQNPEAVDAAAQQLADRFWDCRKAFAFGVPAMDVDTCIETAMASDVHPVVISDSGDNPTAGGVGDTPIVLAALLAHNVPDALLAGIADAVAVDVCTTAGVGATVALSVGGKLDALRGPPVDVTGTVLTLRDDAAVVQVAGVKLVLTRQRQPFHYLPDFARLDIDPSAHRILVVKMGYLVPDIKALAAVSLLALSPGVVTQDIAALPLTRVRRPMYFGETGGGFKAV